VKIFQFLEQKNYVMIKSTTTLTQNGLLAVLLERQRYKELQLARRRAQRKHMRAAFCSTLTWLWRALTAPKLRDDSAEPMVGAFSHRTFSESRLLELPSTLTRRGSNESIAATHCVLEKQGKDLWNMF
jgi:hypothetical protein